MAIQINFNLNIILISIGAISFSYLAYSLRDKMSDATLYSLIVVVASLTFGLISDYYYENNEDVGIFGERREDHLTQEEISQIGEDL